MPHLGRRGPSRSWAGPAASAMLPGVPEGASSFIARMPPLLGPKRLGPSRALCCVRLGCTWAQKGATFRMCDTAQEDPHGKVQSRCGKFPPIWWLKPESILCQLWR